MPRVGLEVCEIPQLDQLEEYSEIRLALFRSPISLRRAVQRFIERASFKYGHIDDRNFVICWILAGSPHEKQKFRFIGFEHIPTDELQSATDLHRISPKYYELYKCKLHRWYDFILDGLEEFRRAG